MESNRTRHRDETESIAGVVVFEDGEIRLPKQYPNYSSVDYWNRRYQEEQGQTYEWLLQLDSIVDLLISKIY